MNKKLLFLTVFLVAVFLFYLPTFSYYFAQDDFFHLKMSQVNNWSDFSSFFSLKNSFGYKFYRPLTTQVFLYGSKTAFGLHPLGYRVIIFLFFLANIFLVYKIAKVLTSQEKIGLLSAFLYAFSSSHFATLSYISTFEEIGVTFFFLLSIYYYLKNNNFSLLFFIFALMSRETAVTLPFILLAIELLKGGKIKKTLVYFGILAAYLFLRFKFGISLPGETYGITLSPKKILNGLFWYGYWTVGAPESLVDFIGPGLKINPGFLKIFGWKGLILMLSPLIFAGLFIFNLVKEFIKNPKNRKNIFFLSFWFVATLSPFLLLPQHKYVYYLEIPLFGFWTLFSLSIKEYDRKIKILFLIFFLATSFLTINFYQKTYWVTGRARLSLSIINELKKTYPQLPPGATLYFKNDLNSKFISNEWGGTSTQAKVAISGCNAVQVIYNDDSLKCYFEDDKDQIDLKDAYRLVVKDQDLN